MTTTEQLLQEIDKLPDLNLENEPDFISDVAKGKVINDILSIMEDKKINQLSLAHKLGKSKQYISRILKEKTNLTIDSLAQIACALDADFKISIHPRASENYYPEESYFTKISSEAYQKSLSFWQMGFYYLHSSQAVFNQTLKEENKLVVFSDTTVDIETYDKKTEFSDFNIMVPTLFCLYHSFELILKGFVLLKKDVSFNHKIEELYSEFKNEYSDQNDICDILDKYILTECMLEPLKSFFTENGISANKFYEVLRYPVKKKDLKKYEFFELYNNGKEGIPFFKKTVKNISKLRPLFVTLGRQYELK